MYMLADVLLYRTERLCIIIQQTTSSVAYNLTHLEC